MESSAILQPGDAVPAVRHQRLPEPSDAAAQTQPSFHEGFVLLFDAHFHQLYRYLDRLTGEPELAADLAQETFIRLYSRGSAPDSPQAWLIAVAMNLLRNAKSKRSRRLRLMSAARSEAVLADPATLPGDAADAAESRRRVRCAIQRLSERERGMLLLWAEGYSYRDIASALNLNKASIGTLLARARRAFHEAYADALAAR